MQLQKCWLMLIGLSYVTSTVLPESDNLWCLRNRLFSIQQDTKEENEETLTKHVNLNRRISNVHFQSSFYSMI